MSKSTTIVSGGIGFPGLLAIVFITLKLTGFINWSWIWVLAPLWISFALFLAILGVLLGTAGICAFVAWLIEIRK